MNQEKNISIYWDWKIEKTIGPKEIIKDAEWQYQELKARGLSSPRPFQWRIK